MALSDLFQLDPTSATSNSNFAGANIAENCAPSGINNALRALGSMVARAICYQSAAISASVSTNIAGASTGLYMGVTGSGAINSFGVIPGEQPSAAVFRFLEFSSSASLSHGGSIFLPGGQSIRTQPGDVLGVLHEGSGDQWRGLFYSRAGSAGLLQDSLSVTTITNRSMSTSAISTVTLNAASASITAIGITALNSVNSISASVGNFTLLKVGGHGTVAQQVSARTSAHHSSISSSFSIPYDDSIPQITEGFELLSVTITPTNAASILDVRAECLLGTDSTTIGTVAIFRDSTANAIAAKGVQIGTNTVGEVSASRQISASSTAQTVFHVRVGPNTGGMMGANGESSVRRYGGASDCSIVVTEILPQ